MLSAHCFQKLNKYNCECDCNSSSDETVSGKHCSAALDGHYEVHEAFSEAFYVPIHMNPCCRDSSYKVKHQWVIT